MRQASGISERGPSRPEAWITTGRSGLCHECGERVDNCVDCALFQCDECAANYDDRSCCCGRIVSYPDDEHQSYAGHVEISIGDRTCCLPPSRRQAAAQALAGDAYDVVRKVEHDRLKRVEAQLVGSDIETAQTDLRRIMAELGMKLHARSESSHDVVMHEVLPRIREVMADHKDRPEPVDPASVRVLAALLDEVDADLGMHNIITSTDYARRLIRRGVEVSE